MDKFYNPERPHSISIPVKFDKSRSLEDCHKMIDDVFQTIITACNIFGYRSVIIINKNGFYYFHPVDQSEISQDIYTYLNTKIEQLNTKIQQLKSSLNPPTRK